MTPRVAAFTAVCFGISLFILWGNTAYAQTQSAFQQSGALQGGGIYVLRKDATAPTAAVELWFRAPAPGYDARFPGMSRLALTALAASRPAHGTSFSELVNRYGGTLSIQIYPDIAMIGASVPASRAAAVLHALTQAFFAPSLGEGALKAAVRDAAIAAAQVQFDPERTLQDSLFAQLFVSGPAHYAPTPSVASDFAKIPSSDVLTYAQRAFRRQNTVLAAAGNVDASLLKSIAPGTAGAPMDAPFDSELAAARAQTAQRSTATGIGFAWTGPPIAATREATALDFVADYLFEPNHGAVATELDRAHGDLFVNGQFITLHDPGVLLVTLSGAGAPAVQDRVLEAIAKAQTPMEAPAFEAARRAFEYHILEQIQTPLGRADALGWYAAEGNAPYAPGDGSETYMRAAESLDPGFVAATARKYLQHPAIVRLNSPQTPQGSATR